MEPILRIEGLKLHFVFKTGSVQALKGIYLAVNKGETLGLVGETGCGKSVLASAIIGLVPFPGKVVEGRIIFGGKDLAKASKEELLKIRQTEVAVVFQDPSAYLDPLFTIYDQVAESAAVSNGIEMGRRIAMLDAFGAPLHPTESKSLEEIETFLKERVVESLRRVKMPLAEKTMMSYPHELSGGMKQRATIAMSITKQPKLVILDEATTALDVTTQAQILDLLRDLKKEFNITVLMITHDLGVASEICDRIAVMYAGEVAEVGPADKVLSNPLHPYTRGLLKAIPRLRIRGKRLDDIQGQLPSVTNPPKGCLFAARCPEVWEKCLAERPATVQYSESRQVKCNLYDK